MRPIVGIENRTAQEVFDIMSDRIRYAAREGWQPIETAPKDGSRFLAAYSDGRVVEAFYLDNSHTLMPWAGVRQANSMMPVRAGERFTHWRPLPTPPAIKETTTNAG